MIISADLTLPAEAAFVPVVRRLSGWLLNQLNVVESDVDDVELIVGEICGNVVKHAYGVPEAKYLVEFDFHSDQMVVTVTDQGRGMERKCVPTPEAGQVSGYGIWLVENIADKVRFSCPEGSPGTRVQAVVYLHYQTPEDRQHAEQLEEMSETPRIKVTTEVDDGG